MEKLKLSNLSGEIENAISKNKISLALDLNLINRSESNSLVASISMFSSNELITHFGSLVKTERKITEQILECIVEIDRRKIYLQKAYPSLFEFLVKEYGYSPSAAMRRIESARLLKEIPEVSEKIKSGSINLSQLAQVQQTLRAVQKQEGLKVSTLQKTELLKKIENTTQAKTELILAQEFNLPTARFDKEKIHHDESVTLTITFSKEQMGLLEKAQALVSHSVPDQKWSEVISYLAEKEVKLRTAKDKAETKNLNSKYVSVKSRNTLLDPATACCQFKDLNSGKVCGSRQFLQIDHIQPRWAGGGNQTNNLQVLCGAHNRYRYKLQSGFTPSPVVGKLQSVCVSSPEVGNSQLSFTPSPMKSKSQLGFQT